jgi:hypothetical protein
MSSNGSTREPREERTVGRWGKGLGMGLLIGGAVGVVVGLVLGSVAFSGAAALAASALGGGIFGSGVGAFIGGMSKLEDPPPGEEPGVGDQPLDRPGLTHPEHER